MLVITAPTNYEASALQTTIFLGGGIQKCWEWQQACIDEIKRLAKVHKINTSNLVIYNPRRPVFDKDAKTREIQKQIEWEYHHLEYCDIFSMYFCESESVQPICMYELGRNVAKKFHQYTPERAANSIVVSAEIGYSRYLDVAYQLFCVYGEKDFGKAMTGMKGKDILVKDHARRLLVAYMANQSEKVGYVITGGKK